MGAGVRRPGARCLAKAARCDRGALAQARRRRRRYRRRDRLLRQPAGEHAAALGEVLDHVWLDIDRVDMVKYLAERAQREGRKNLIAVAAKPDDPRLPDKIDLLLLVDVYHHIDAREQYLRRLRPALKPGGRIAIIDFRLDSPGGPPRRARIAPEQVKAELAKAGYTLYEEHSFLPRQYFLVFHAAE